MIPWLGLGAVAVGVTAASALGARRWERATARAVARLARGAAPDAAARFDERMLEGLPRPVAAYLACALTPGQPLVARARIRHEGEFAQSPGRWRPFSSVQHFGVRPPGFVWDAAIRMAPGVTVRVRDSYLEGEGAMHAAIAGLVTVAERRGTPGMAAGALARFLAECAWFPTALLPDGQLAWTALDARSARATLTDRGTTVSLDFHFGRDGELLGVSGQRHRATDGGETLTPFEGRFAQHRRMGGMRVPAWGEVAWLLPEGRYAYWRAHLVEADYGP